MTDQSDNPATSDIARELSEVKDKLSEHADLIDELKSKDAQIEEHITNLDSAVRDMKKDMRGLTEQSARTEASLRAFREVQTENHKDVIQSLADIRKDVSNSMQTAMESTPNSIKLGAAVAGLVGTAVLIVIAIMGGHVSP